MPRLSLYTIPHLPFIFSFNHYKILPKLPILCNSWNFIVHFW
jgi:hypothetical protein